jgi:D-sedoheptulose 7-phosphate isomerase
MKNIILHILQESIAAKRRCIEDNLDNIVKAADMISNCLAAGQKLLIFGNGGSAADAQHLAAEFVNRFQLERPPLAALALTTDTSVITSIANDYSFEEIFAKQIEALGKAGDIAWGISTSGNSANVIRAAEIARKKNLAVIAMTGRTGQLAQCADIVFTVDVDKTARIQEAHIALGHILCDLVERTLYPEQLKKK